MKTFLFLLGFLPAFAQAETVAIAKFVGGNVTAGNQPLKVGAQVESKTWIHADATGKAILVLVSTDAEIRVLPGTEIQLAFKGVGKPQDLFLKSGTVRATLPKKKDRVQFRVRTPTATLGVRGTDFLGVYAPLLRESEIIVFEGSVQFQNVAHPRDLKMVPAEHWGGVGGRFGSKIGTLIHLPAGVLSHFNQATQF